MTQHPDFDGNRKTWIVIPAACLALLTLGSVPFYGNFSFLLPDAILIILFAAVSLIIIFMHTTSPIRE